MSQVLNTLAPIKMISQLLDDLKLSGYKLVQDNIIINEVAQRISV